MNIGAVTIGQSPRTDVTGDLKSLLPNTTLIERGALDHVDIQTLERMRQQPKGDILATRLRNGCEVLVGEEDILPLVKEAIYDLACQDVELILLLCTGTFPNLRCSVPILYPEKTLQAMVTATFLGGSLGIITPSERQRTFQQARWETLVSTDVFIEVASPYQADWMDTLPRAAKHLEHAGVSMIVLDCLGYTVSMRNTVRNAVKLPTLLARSVLGRFAAELMGI